MSKPFGIKKNKGVLLDACKKAGYSIIAIGMPCNDLPLSMGIQKNDPPLDIQVSKTIFAGPEDARITKGGISIPAIWEIGRLTFDITAGFGHSIVPDGGMCREDINKEDRGVFRLIGEEWQAEMEV